MAVSASAQAFPCFPPYPIFGKYDFFGLNEGKVTIEVSGFGQTISKDASVNQYGEYSEDICNFGFPSSPYPGMSVTLKACDTKSECVKTYLTSTAGRIKHDFVFVDEKSTPIPPSSGDKTVIPIAPPIVYVCYDGTKVTDESKCPIAPEPEIPEDDNQLLDYLIGLIAGVLVLFGWGKGFAALIKYKLEKAKEEDKKGNKELAARYRATAEKMAKSVITNFLAGKYKK